MQNRNGIYQHLSGRIKKWLITFKWKLLKKTPKALIARPDCPVCASPTVFIAENAYFHVVRCIRCGHATVAADVNDIELSGLYNDAQYWHQNQEHQGIRYFMDEGSWDSYLESRLHPLYHHVGLSDDAPKKVLEVGCSEGKVLGVLKKRGHDVVGIECSRPIAETGAKTFGIPIHSKAFTLCDFNGDRFDIILGYHVFEHFADIHAAAQRMAELLAFGGKVLLEIPIETVYHCEDHMHFFTHASATEFFGKYFKSVAIHANRFEDAHGNTVESAFIVLSN